MNKQTKLEKIELAQKEIEQAEVMVKSSRENFEKWINLLDMRREYLDFLNPTVPIPPSQKPGRKQLDGGDDA